MVSLLHYKFMFFSFFLLQVDEAGRPEDQQAFIKEVEAYNKENFLDFKAPKFYGQPLNCLK